MGAYNAALIQKRYQENAVSTASPLRLVIMLYGGVLRFIRVAQKSFSGGDEREGKNNLLQVEKIVLELIGSLNLEEGGEVARNLLRIYQFTLEQCALCNGNNYSQILPPLLKVWEGLEESWREIEKNG
ncbi:MAG TPA: flagellar export chaperone FliS [Candidatus Atribacteria bacterium]|nr:flagellar export chaperone FliS [Candidatus Atribacteria bacterium]HOQ51655.1 flagellar export chaperone FliS [Candidatus Atribacteria bacterium]HQD33756.1 flagellar export chaperone FliS [Candidatus Atribacteria bacterium]